MSNHLIVVSSKVSSRYIYPFNILKFIVPKNEMNSCQIISSYRVNGHFNHPSLASLSFISLIRSVTRYPISASTTCPVTVLSSQSPLLLSYWLLSSFLPRLLQLSITGIPSCRLVSFQSSLHNTIKMIVLQCKQYLITPQDLEDKIQVLYLALHDLPIVLALIATHETHFPPIPSTFVIYGYITNHLKTQWHETTTIQDL